MLHRAAWQAGLVDRVQLFVTPHRLGESAVAWLDEPDMDLSNLEEISRTSLGDDIMVEGYVHRAD
jgi:riboflavin biosynthesis pyrimidine reductase